MNIEELILKILEQKNDSDSGSGGELGEFLLYTFLYALSNIKK